MVLPWDKDIRPMKGMWAPGEYACKCCNCGGVFIGDKRAITCSSCAYGDTDALASLFAVKLPTGSGASNRLLPVSESPCVVVQVAGGGEEEIVVIFALELLTG